MNTFFFIFTFMLSTYSFASTMTPHEVAEYLESEGYELITCEEVNDTINTFVCSTEIIDNTEVCTLNLDVEVSSEDTISITEEKLSNCSPL